MNTRLSSLSITILISLLFAGSCLANGLIVVTNPLDHAPPVIIPEPPRPPHPRPWPIPRPPRPIDRHMPLDLKEQQVDISIKDQVVTTKVKQIFENPTSRRFEGTFLFPVPKNAQVKKFSMEVNGELVEAELLDAKKARKIYEDIVRRCLDPALFEYADQGLFKVRIFPIEPHSTKEVRIEYTELLPMDNQVVRYSYPLNTTKYCRKPIENFSMKVEIEASEGKALKTVYSPSHEIEVSRKGKRRAVLGLETDKMAVDQDFLLYYSLKPAGDKPIALDFLTYHEDKDDPGHFMLLVSPDVWDATDDEVLPKDVVFVFDSSGSMRGAKMEQAQAAVKYCVENLNPEDRFEVIRFSTEAEPVFEELTKATKANREKALKFIKSVRAIGGTAIQEALNMAVETAAESAKEGRPSQIIFMTDGKPTLGATREEVILKSVEKAMGETEKDVRIFCFGIGTNINTHLLDLVTEKTRAVSQYVLPDEDIEEKVSRFYAKISDPILTDLKIKIDGADWVRNRYPNDLPDLFRGDQLVVLGRYQSDQAKGKITLTGHMKGEKKTFKYDVRLGSDDDENSFIAHLWATRRVGYLLDKVRLEGESEELKEEIAQLARKFGIVTPYTTFLIVEDETRRDVPAQFRSTSAPSSIGSGGRVEIGRSRGGASGGAVDPFSAASEEYDSLRSKSDGADAVAGASVTGQLKEAKKLNIERDANEFADRARGRQVRIIPSRNIGGKTFYQKGESWVDGEAQALAKNVKRRQIKFGTDEYFEFLVANPRATQWFSVGQNLQLVIDDELVEIVN